MTIQKLTEAEELVMRAVWDCKREPELKHVCGQINDVYGKEWKSQTVSTLIYKLCQKQYLRLQRNGRTCTYKILINENIYNKEQLRKVYLFLYKNDKEKLRADVEEL